MIFEFIIDNSSVLFGQKTHERILQYSAFGAV
jgi:hypothetical protein